MMWNVKVNQENFLIFLATFNEFTKFDSLFKWCKIEKKNKNTTSCYTEFIQSL